jgi:eukaryotic-like serine/threonine-protein kinase
LSSSPQYLRSGHLVYGLPGGGLMAVPFDVEGLRVTGNAALVAAGVRQSTVGARSQFGISDTGTLVYVPGSANAGRRTLVWVDRKGVEQVVPAPPHAYFHPRQSPGSRRLAITMGEGLQGGTHVWFGDLRRGALSRGTFAGSINYTGPWTPDGQRIALFSNQNGSANVFWQRADGSGGLEQLRASEYNESPNSWSPDAQSLAIIQINPATRYDIWLLNMSDRKARPFLQTPFNETAPSFSPDGHWLAYASDESGRSQIYVTPVAGTGGKWLVSPDSGSEPVWNPDGRELFYRDGTRMMAVDVTNPTTRGNPRMLFEGPYLLTPFTFPNYDVSADGQRFLLIKPSGEAEALAQMIVVLNWSEELKRLVPAEAQ